MGVLGLTTFVREHVRELGRCVRLEKAKGGSSRGSEQPGKQKPEIIVIDGWSFIYNLARNVHLPWVYGGEYEAFAEAVKNAVRAFLDVGLILHFVFDGALQPQKFPTKVKRIASNAIIPSQLFFRTSQQARTSPRFLAENRIQPPLYYLATLEALNSFSSSSTSTGPQNGSTNGDGKSPERVTIHMADDDADKFAVELAGRLGAYCLSNDSDYLILNCEGYKGYVTFDDLRWIFVPNPSSHVHTSLLASGLTTGSSTPLTPSETSSMGDSFDFDDLGFTTVTNKKSKKTKAHRSRGQQHQTRAEAETRSIYGLPLPSNSNQETEQLTGLSFTTFHPSDLANLLKLPVSLLPLVASLIGNEFSDSGSPSGLSDAGSGSGTGSANGSAMESGSGGKPNRMFFENRLPASQRVTRVSEVLLSVLYPRKQHRTAGPGPGQPAVNLTGMKLITAAVGKLLLRPDLVSGRERERVVDGIVDCVLRYAVVPTLLLEENEEREKVCSLHDADGCPLYLLDALLEERASESEDGQSEEDYPHPSLLELHAQKFRIRSLYISSYRRTSLSPNILNIVGTSTFWTPGMLEDPDRETCERSVGAGLRRWVYAVLGRSVGVGVALGREEELAEDGEDGKGEDEEDPDELIDVVEEDSEEGEEEEMEEEDDSESDAETETEAGARGANQDILSPARRNRVRESLERVKSRDGKQKRVSFVGEDVYVDGGGLGAGVIPIEIGRNGKGGKKEEEERKKAIVAEYVRRGVRVADVGVEVESIREMFASSPRAPPASSSESNAHVPVLPQLLPATERIAFFLRAMGSDVPSLLSKELPRQYLLYIVCIRWVVRCMGERTNPEERWTKREAKCLLASVLNPPPSSSSGSTSQPPVALINRHIQLTAQFLTALSNAILLVQILLLTEEVPTTVLGFSGKRFHRLLQTSSPSFSSSASTSTSATASSSIYPASTSPQASSSNTDPNSNSNSHPTDSFLQSLGINATEETVRTFNFYWRACEEGLDAFWGIERESKKARKQAQAQARKESQDQPPDQGTSQGGGKGKGKGKGIAGGGGGGGGKGKAKGAGLFALLAEMEGEGDDA